MTVKQVKTDTYNPNKDNWMHRSTEMRCATCMWYLPKASHNIKAIGRCRRHAPTMAGFPAVYPTDWCGDHKLDETKLYDENDPT